jgi:lipid II:glycine glycyltransferase (peptidoglycan interpeptide bridge formation enzyme)
MRFQSEGEEIYDFGGWYAGKRDQKRLGINRFKEEFGGKIIRNFICESGVTLKGKIFLQVRRLLLGDAI